MNSSIASYELMFVSGWIEIIFRAGVVHLCETFFLLCVNVWNYKYLT